MTSITTLEARRLALARAGLLKPAWTGFPSRAGRSVRSAETAAVAIVGRFGYLQLDTVSVAGARSHTIVLLSRLEGFDPALGESLLRPGVPLFEYWGHEASWIPIDLYPAFEFRRREFRHHPWWGDIAGSHPEVAKALRQRIRREGPLRSVDIEGPGSRGWWDINVAKRIATQLWSSGELAIRERRNFQRTYDRADRVIPQDLRRAGLPQPAGLDVLLLRALEGHGWATTGTLAATWRLRNRREEVLASLARLRAAGRIEPCTLQGDEGPAAAGWIRPEDRELAGRLRRVRPARDRGVLLSPFDPLLWDRNRLRRLFGFEQMLEVYKPAPDRVYGYYCLPVLAGERLIGRVDLKAERRAGLLRVLSCRFEDTKKSTPASGDDERGMWSALARYSGALGLEPVGWPGARRASRGAA
jgi:uncharacterized protein YcaQ